MGICTNKEEGICKPTIIFIDNEEIIEKPEDSHDENSADLTFARRKTTITPIVIRKDKKKYIVG